MPPQHTSITLRALDGAPLDDELVRRNVVATARAIAERTGVRLVGLEAFPDRVEATLEADRLGAIGFAAELRRLTDAWHRARTDGLGLWGGPEREDDFLLD